MYCTPNATRGQSTGDTGSRAQSAVTGKKYKNDSLINVHQPTHLNMCTLSLKRKSHGYRCNPTN